MPFIKKINAACICLLFIIIVSNYAYGKTGRSLRRVANDKDTSKDVSKEHNRHSPDNRESRKDSKRSGGESKGSGDDSKGPARHSKGLREDSKISGAKSMESGKELGGKSNEIGSESKESGGKSKRSRAESDISTDESRSSDGSFSEEKLKEKKIRILSPLWEKGTVPYRIDKKSYDNIIIRRIHEAMKAIEAASCVIFKNITRTPRRARRLSFIWLYITNPGQERDCVHETRIGSYGAVVMVLGFECMQKQDITHALLHVLGFRDEVTHPQRDSYVRVLWENIQPKYHPLFAIQNVPPPYLTSVEYDTMSVMHFHDRAYSSNGGATVTPLISGLLINPSEGLSQLDVMKLRLAFGQECNKRKVDTLLQTCRNNILLGSGSSSGSNSDSKEGDSRGGYSKISESKEGDSNKRGYESNGQERDSKESRSDDDNRIVSGSDKVESGNEKSFAGSGKDGTDSGSNEIGIVDISDDGVANKPPKDTSKGQETKGLTGSKWGTPGGQKRGRGWMNGHRKPKHLRRSKKQKKVKQTQKKAKQKQMKSKQKQMRTKQKLKGNKTKIDY